MITSAKDLVNQAHSDFKSAVLSLEVVATEIKQSLPPMVREALITLDGLYRTGGRC